LFDGVIEEYDSLAVEISTLLLDNRSFRQLRRPIP